MTILRQAQEREFTAPLRQLIVIPVTQLTTSAVTIHTVPDDLFFEIRGLWVANTGASATFTAHVVPDGGSAATANQIFGGVTIAANTTEDLLDAGSIIMDEGSTLQVLASVGTRLNLTMWGQEITGGE